MKRYKYLNLTYDEDCITLDTSDQDSLDMIASMIQANFPSVKSFVIAESGMTEFKSQENNFNSLKIGKWLRDAIMLKGWEIFAVTPLGGDPITKYSYHFKLEYHLP